MPAEGQIVWCGRSIGAKYVVGKKQMTRLERWTCVSCWGPGFPLQAAGNHQREECAENSDILMEERTSNVGLGR